MSSCPAKTQKVTEQSFTLFRWILDFYFQDGYTVLIKALFLTVTHFQYAISNTSFMKGLITLNSEYPFDCPVQVLRLQFIESKTSSKYI